MGDSMKKELGKINCLYPMPTVLVGANVKDKPNFITMAHVGIMSPNTISLGMNKIHYTNNGIKENNSFSVNIPTIENVKKTDYCGLVSGKCEDKAKIFKIFYGKLKNAPMIEDCPINMECNLIKTVDFPHHDIFIGEIVETYSDDSIISNEKVDIKKLDPILFVMNDRGYYKIGDRIAQAWEVGKELKADSKM